MAPENSLQKNKMKLIFHILILTQLIQNLKQVRGSALVIHILMQMKMIYRQLLNEGQKNLYAHFMVKKINQLFLKKKIDVIQR